MSRSLLVTICSTPRLSRSPSIKLNKKANCISTPLISMVPVIATLPSLLIVSHAPSMAAALSKIPQRRAAHFHGKVKCASSTTKGKQMNPPASQ
jgi:hypothetical protein